MGLPNPTVKFAALGLRYRAAPYLYVRHSYVAERSSRKGSIACGRKCCICHRFCGVNELHHIWQEADGGLSDFDNCIPLCFDCHADVGHYNPRHPKGKKYTPGELKGHRDQWYALTSQLRLNEFEQNNSTPEQPVEVYEGQEVSLRGYVWRESFPGRPNYESFDTDEKETYGCSS